MMISTHGGIHAANPSACELLGFSEDEIVAGGREFVVASAEELRHALRIRESAGRFTGELDFNRKDGTVIRCDVTSVTYSDGDGQWAMIVFRDASEREEARGEK
ncbi:MAG: PAS domain-containing protein [Gammaproteobacteria bacterium]|nr:PAS domain-containing protein [Gammaproteobacteria bacterium]